MVLRFTLALALALPTAAQANVCREVLALTRQRVTEAVSPERRRANEAAREEALARRLLRLNAQRPAAFELPARLQILVWNVFKGHRADWGGDIRELIANADLALLQEFRLSEKNLNEVEGAGLDWAMSITHFSDDATANGVATASRASIKSSYPVASPSFEPLLKTSKAAVISEHAIEGRRETLLVVNVHALNFVRLASFTEQFAQISPVIGAHKGPVLVAGDFNTWSGARLRTLTSLLAEHSVTQVPLPRTSRLQLDGAFTRGLKIELAETLTHITSSDHSPILLKVEVE